MPTLISLEHVSVEKKKSKSKKKEEQQQHEQGETTENEELLDQNNNGTHSKHKHKRKKSESVKGGEPSPKRSKKDEDKENKKNWSSHSDNDDDDRSEEKEKEEEEEEAKHPPNALENFKISDVLRNKLKSKGINSLFPIQAMTYDFILQGNDLVGRARTGQGKTLAFVLPIIESLTNGRNARDKSSSGYGRRPSVIVLVPTRELAKQVHSDFDVYGGVLQLASCCVYGGSAYGPQEQALRRGVDIVIGTPGRIKDLIEKGILNLKSLKFRVLDEADEMLNMGFVEDVEIILGKVENASLVQTLLFSATMPDWVKKISSRFLKPEKKTADLVGDDKMKASKSVKHIAIPCFYTARPTVIPDVIQCYSSGGRVIVFTETKNDASELAQLLPGGARALHGDIQQSQRETILAGFRSGKFVVLVATDVAARGLDINDVQLIIQCEPPRDVETYIHRSGRTGRAGNTGISVMLYGQKKQYLLAQIERQAGFNFDYVSAPQPADIVKATGNSVVESVLTVDDSVLPIFRKPAELLMESGNLAPVDIIAKALAKIAGYTEVKRRSLMNSEEDFVTLILKVGKIMYTPSYAFNVFRRFLPEENISSVKRLSLTADSMGAVFDVPKDEVDTFLEGNENAAQVSIEILESLPDLQGKKDQSWGGYQSSWGGGRRGGGYNSRGGGRGRGRGRGRRRGF